MKIAIVGSREFPDMDLVREFVRSLPEDTIIISGGARGVDRVAEEEAKKLAMITEIYPADWQQYGKRAGFLRNKQIVEAADMVQAFWDGKSKGTAHSIRLAKEAGKPVQIRVVGCIGSFDNGD